jgi:hypothetical protein
VCAATGVTPTTREHLAAALALGLPVAFALTKADAAPPPRLAAALAGVAGLAEAAGGAAARVDGAEAAADAAAALSALRDGAGAASSSSFGGGGGGEGQRAFPVFVTSAVTGEGLPDLHACLSRLQPAPTAAAGGEAAADSGCALREGQLLLLGRDEGSGGSSSLRSCSTGAPASSSTAGSSGGASGSGSSGDSSSDGSCSGSDCDGAAGAGSRRCAAGSAARNLAACPPAAAPGAPGHFQVFHTFQVEGSAVVCGICVEGSIRLGQPLLWGPGACGGFAPAVVAGIHRGQLPVRAVGPGQTATLALVAASPAPQRTSDGGGGGVGELAGAAAAAAALRCREARARTTRQRELDAAAMEADAQLPGSLCVLASGSRGAACSSGGDGSFGALLDAAAADLGNCSGASSSGGGSDGEDDDGGLGGFGFSFEEDEEDAAAAPGRRDDSSASSGSGSFCAPRHRSEGRLRGAAPLGASAPAGSAGVGGLPRHLAALSLSAPRPGAGASAAPRAVPRGARGPPNAGGCLGASLSSAPRKGGVLLDSAASPATHREFEAVVVLLGGRWPGARCGGGSGGGAGSGAFGCGCGGGGGGLSGADGSAGAAAGRCFVVHCNSVRQLARVVAAERVCAAGAAAAGLPCGVAAAAALLRPSGGGGGGGGAAAAAPAAARVRLRFAHRPEWLRAGARVLLRDRDDGHLAAAGCVAALLGCA